MSGGILKSLIRGDVYHLIKLEDGSMWIVMSVAARVLFVGIIALWVGSAFSQSYPNKPIRIISAGDGGAIYLAARATANAITEGLGQQAIVDPRSGANNIIAVRALTSAPPDGYTLLAHSSGMWLLPLLRDDVPYDPIKDFAPVGLVTTTPNLLVVHPSIKVQSVKELIALAKSKPGVLNYSSGSAGAGTHLAGELFKDMADVDIVRVPFKGAAPAILALLSGQTQLMFANVSAGLPLANAGKLKALALTSKDPYSLAPGIPTMAASGLPGYEVTVMFGIFAAAKVPPAIVEQLNQEMVRHLNSPKTKDEFLKAGLDVTTTSPRGFSDLIKSDMTRMGAVIKKAGIREED